MSDSSCIRCGNFTTNHYRFYFGKEIGQPMLGANATGYQTVTHRYEIGGSEDVRLCDECTKANWLDRLLVIPANSTPEQQNKILGTKKAISVRKSALRRQGWTNFWTEDEYDNLSLSMALRR